MRLLILSIFAAISLSSCPGSSANTTHGQMTATFSNIVGTPSNFSLTQFNATKVISGSSSSLTSVSATEGNRVIQITLTPGLVSGSRACVQPNGQGDGCGVGVGVSQGGFLLSTTTNLNASRTGNELTISGTVHFQKSDGSLAFDMAINSTSTITVNAP